jgi:Ca2+-binding RTX toxin-like protein
MSTWDAVLNAAVGRSPRIAVPAGNINAPEVVAATNQFTGVALIATPGNSSCTGTLLAGDGQHILTAAHCLLSDNNSRVETNPGVYQVSFVGPNGTFTTVPVAQVIAHPNYQGTSSRDDNDFDLAILKLSQNAPDFADRYGIYRGSDEVGKIAVRVGFGNPGTGASGQIESDEAIKRFGNNRYDAIGDIFRQPPVSDNSVDPAGLQIAFDFDNGNPANDAFGRTYNLIDLGVPGEVNTAQGDSGGPAFIDNQIAGVVSYGFSPLEPGVDVDLAADPEGNNGNSSFGEYSVDTRVSAFANYIDETLAQSRSGNDAIAGTSRNDLLYGNRGNDTLTGSTGDDTLAAGRDADQVFGEDGNDLVNGNRGNDFVDGGNGNDTVNGGQDDDTLTGGGGNDILSGDLGNDLLTGGAGSDRFDFRPDVGGDVITDFADGVDQIGLAGGVTFAALGLAQVGADVQITGPGFAVILQNVNLGAINSADFVQV